MSWLSVPAVGTNSQLPVVLDGAIALIALIGGLKDTLQDLSTKNTADLLDELASKPVNPAAGCLASRRRKNYCIEDFIRA